MTTDAWLLDPPPIEGEVALDFTVAFAPYASDRARFAMDFVFTAEGTMLPSRAMSPGAILIGKRAPGFVDPRIWNRAGLSIPFPPPDDPNVYVGTGNQATGPYAIDEYAYAADGRYFYLISGYWGQGVGWDQWSSNRLYRFDAVTETWAELARIPGFVGSEGCTAQLIDGKIYVIMGDTGIRPTCSTCEFPDPEHIDGDDMLRSLWIYDIAGDSWVRGPQPPWQSTYSGSAALDGKFYLVQMYGVSWNETPGFAVFDPVAGTWTVLADQPFVPYDAPTTWAGDGKVWSANRDNNTSEIYIVSYDPGTGVWTNETAGFATWLLEASGPTTDFPFFDASAVVRVSDSVVWLLGGIRIGVSYVSHPVMEVDVVAKTATQLSISWPAGTYDSGYYGGFRYGGTTYATGPRQSQIQSSGHPAGMWKVQ